MKDTMTVKRHLYNDGILNVLHMLPAEMRERVNRERVEEALSGLGENERRVLELRFGFDSEETPTYEEIGGELGMSAMGAMKLFKRTCKKVIDRMQKFD